MEDRKKQEKASASLAIELEGAKVKWELHDLRTTKWLPALHKQKLLTLNISSRLQQIEKRHKEECVKLTAECNNQLTHYKGQCAAKDAELSSLRESKQISIQVYMLLKYFAHLYFLGTISV